MKTHQTSSNKKNRHFKALKTQVSALLAEENLSWKMPALSRNKAFILFALWAMLYFLFLTLGASSPILALCFAVLWSLPMASIQFVVMHEASHNAASNSKLVNAIYTATISFLGGSSLLWIKQHCVAHHNNTNISGLDHDINTNGLLRLHPSQPIKQNHKYQHLYAWALYPLFVLSWIWWGDFRDLLFNTYSLTKKELWLATIETIVVKIWHIVAFILLPIYAFQSIPLALLCYTVSFMVIGFFMVVIFQLAHVSAIQTMPNAKTDFEDDWAIRQLYTTANFAPNNSLLTWLIGGLNFQIEHHLFPSMNHAHYRKISDLVKRYCKENDLPYLEYKTVFAAIAGHQRHLIEYRTAYIPQH